MQIRLTDWNFFLFNEYSGPYPGFLGLWISASKKMTLKKSKKFEESNTLYYYHKLHSNRTYTIYQKNAYLELAKAGKMVAIYYWKVSYPHNGNDKIISKKCSYAC